MKRVLILMTGIFFLQASWVWCAQEGVKFELLRGRAFLMRNGGANWLDLIPHKPEPIGFNDKIKTDNESRGELTFPDDSLFRVKSNSIVTLLNGGLQLQVGETWFNLQKQGRAFQVVTPTTVCGVLGTQFDVNVDKFGKTQVRVFDGIVSVRAQEASRRQMVLQRGMMTKVNDRSHVDLQIQKFDPKQIEKQMKDEWKVKPSDKTKIGPNRPELPPMRQPSPGFEMRHIEEAGTLEKRPNAGKPPLDEFKHQQEIERGKMQGDRPFEEIKRQRELEHARMQENSFRENSEFFRRIEELRMKDRPKPPGELERPEIRGTTGGQTAHQPSNLPNQPQGPGSPGYKQPGTPTPPRPGQGFGQGGPGQIGAQDNRQIRDEMLQLQNKLTQIQNEVGKITGELTVLKQRLGQLTQAKQNAAAVRAQMVRIAQANAAAGQRRENLPTSPTSPTDPNRPQLPSDPNRPQVPNDPNRPQVPTGPGLPTGPNPIDNLDQNQIKERIHFLENRLRELHESQQKLLTRLAELRNRLH
ncbi:FecR domain-containing protein [bacterium]|nr:FecR domain-containing protein [bacterium]